MMHENGWCGMLKLINAELELATNYYAYNACIWKGVTMEGTLILEALHDWKYILKLQYLGFVAYQVVLLKLRYKLVSQSKIPKIVGIKGQQ